METQWLPLYPGTKKETRLRYSTVYNMLEGMEKYGKLRRKQEHVRQLYLSMECQLYGIAIYHSIVFLLSS